MCRLTSFYPSAHWAALNTRAPDIVGCDASAGNRTGTPIRRQNGTRAKCCSRKTRTGCPLLKHTSDIGPGGGELMSATKIWLRTGSGYATSICSGEPVWQHQRKGRPEHAADNSPWGCYLRCGIMFTSPHDAPVAFPAPVLAPGATPTARNRAGNSIGAPQRVPVFRAPKTLTSRAARQNSEEDEK